MTLGENIGIMFQENVSIYQILSNIYVKIVKIRKTSQHLKPPEIPGQFILQHCHF